MKSFTFILSVVVMFLVLPVTAQSSASNQLFNKGEIVAKSISLKDLYNYEFVTDENGVDVTSFKIRLGNHRTLLVKGNTLDGTSKARLQKLSDGATIIIFDVIRNGISDEEAAIIFELER